MSERGRVVRATRRWVTVQTESLGIIEARSSQSAIDLTVGDDVQFSLEGDDYIVHQMLPRRNQLERKSGNRSKVFAANIDALYVVAAPGALFNRDFIDRALIVAEQQQIPVTLIVNKIDLAPETPYPWSCYRIIGYPVIEVSVKYQRDLDILRATIIGEESQWIVLCGLSGVGKSSLLNWLVPGSSQRTDEVSAIGQGKQTTTQPEAFALELTERAPLYIVDLPGFSQFGIDHIQPDELSKLFPEFRSHSIRCDFDNCSHVKELRCGIKKGVEEGTIDQLRYESYCKFRYELDRAQPY